MGDEEELVELARDDAGDEALPDVAGLGLREVVGALVPVVEIADDADGLDVRRPNGEVVAGVAVGVDGGVRAELLVAAVPVSVAEQVKVVVAKVEAAVEGVHRGAPNGYPLPRAVRRPRLPTRFDTQSVLPVRSTFRPHESVSAGRARVDARGRGTEGRASRTAQRCTTRARTRRPSKTDSPTFPTLNSRLPSSPLYCKSLSWANAALI